MTLGPVARALGVFFVSLLVLLLVMSSRAVLEARAALGEATVAAQRGDVDLAIVRLRASARWYAPFNVYATHALTGLERIAEHAQARGEAPRALAAYRSIHAAIMATRSFYTPHRERLARADAQIAALMAAEAPPKIEAQRTEEQRRADYLALLQPSDPSLFGVLLALAGFATWVGSALAFVTFGVDGEGRMVRRLARRSVLGLLLGWIVFALGLRMA